MNDPASYQGMEPVYESFTTWLKVTAGAKNQWRLGGLLLAPYSALAAVLVALTVRLLHHPLFLPLPKGQRELLGAYLAADMVVTNAGNYIYTSGVVGLPLMLTFAAIAYGWLVGKPLYSMPQTIGPLRRRLELRILRWVVHRMRVLLLRDGYSVTTLAAAGVRTDNWRVVPDLAFLFQSDSAPAAQQLFLRIGVAPEKARPWLGVTVINWGAQDRTYHDQAGYEAAVANAVRAFLARTAGHVVFFPQVCGPLWSDDDRVPARRVAAQLADLPGRVTVVDEIVPPELLHACYGQMDLLLGTRLHSNIFALTQGVPVVAIGYQAKTWGTMEMLGLASWVIALEECAGDALTRLLLLAWAERATTATKVVQAVAVVRSQAADALDEIQHDYLTRWR